MACFHDNQRQVAIVQSMLRLRVQCHREWKTHLAPPVYEALQDDPYLPDTRFAFNWLSPKDGLMMYATSLIVNPLCRTSLMYELEKMLHQLVPGEREWVVQR